MVQMKGSIGQHIARVVHAFEKRRTTYGRKWVAVFLNEGTIVIAMHGSLTAIESVLARKPAGAARICESHRHLFASGTHNLHRKITEITGLEVRDNAVEIELATGSVVLIFTTDTSEEEFIRTLAGSAVNT
jgi:uncharacterized protein YbcI